MYNYKYTIYFSTRNHYILIEQENQNKQIRESYSSQQINFNERNIRCTQSVQ